MAALPRNNSNKRVVKQKNELISKSSVHNKEVLVYSKSKHSIFNFKKILKSKNILIAGSGSGVGLVSLVAFLSLGLSGGSNCKVDSQPAYKVFQAFESKWSDSVELAHGTSRMALSQPISDMQSIKQEVEKTDWEKCSQSAADLLIKSMNRKIDGFISFLDPDTLESVVDDNFEDSKRYRSLYYKEYLELLPRKERAETKRRKIESYAEFELISILMNEKFRRAKGQSFTQSTAELDSSVVPDKRFDENYTFNILEPSDIKFIAAATSKKRGLKSYSIGVHVQEDKVLGHIFCESNKASKSILAPTLSEDVWACPIDSDTVSVF